MNDKFSLEQISGIGNIEANSLLRQYLMSQLMELKSINPNLTRDGPKRTQKIELNKPVSKKIDELSTNHARSVNKLVIKESKLKGGGKIEIDDEYLDEIFQKNNR